MGAYKSLGTYPEHISPKIRTMSRDETTKIASDGLRYKSKAGGSPFGGSGHTAASMSCYKCGLHKPRALGTFKRLLNQSMFMCGDCKPVKA